eukprot:8879113-Pyramimonas_sp.AAC.1
MRRTWSEQDQDEVGHVPLQADFGRKRRGHETNVETQILPMCAYAARRSRAASTRRQGASWSRAFGLDARRTHSPSVRIWARARC